MRQKENIIENVNYTKLYVIQVLLYKKIIHFFLSYKINNITVYII